MEVLSGYDVCTRTSVCPKHARFRGRKARLNGPATVVSWIRGHRLRPTSCRGQTFREPVKKLLLDSAQRSYDDNAACCSARALTGLALCCSHRRVIGEENSRQQMLSLWRPCPMGLDAK